MKQYLSILFLIWFLILSIVPKTFAKRKSIGCNVYGAIYIEKEKSRAHFSVFVSEYEEDADLLVFNHENRLFADRVGLWYIVSDRSFADYTIYLESDEAYADFSVYYMDDEAMVGCNP